MCDIHLFILYIVCGKCNFSCRISVSKSALHPVFKHGVFLFSEQTRYDGFELFRWNGIKRSFDVRAHEVKLGHIFFLFSTRFLFLDTDRRVLGVFLLILLVGVQEPVLRSPSFGERRVYCYHIVVIAHKVPH